MQFSTVHSSPSVDDTSHEESGSYDEWCGVVKVIGKFLSMLSKTLVFFSIGKMDSDPEQLSNASTWVKKVVSSDNSNNSTNSPTNNDNNNSNSDSSNNSNKNKNPDTPNSNTPQTSANYNNTIDNKNLTKLSTSSPATSTTTPSDEPNTPNKQFKKTPPKTVQQKITFTPITLNIKAKPEIQEAHHHIPDVILRQGYKLVDEVAKRYLLGCTEDKDKENDNKKEEEGPTWICWCVVYSNNQTSFRKATLTPVSPFLLSFPSFLISLHRQNEKNRPSWQLLQPSCMHLQFASMHVGLLNSKLKMINVDHCRSVSFWPRTLCTLSTRQSYQAGTHTIFDAIY